MNLTDHARALKRLQKMQARAERKIRNHVAIQDAKQALAEAWAAVKNLFRRSK